MTYFQMSHPDGKTSKCLPRVSAGGIRGKDSRDKTTRSPGEIQGGDGDDEDDGLIPIQKRSLRHQSEPVASKVVESNNATYELVSI